VSGIAHPLEWIQKRVPLLRDLPIEITALSLIAFFVALGFGIVAPVIPTFASTFGVTAFMAAAVISAFAFTRLIAAPPAGWLVNRIGERRVLTSGLLIVSASSALAGLSNDYYHLLFWRSLGGFGSTMFTVSAMALLIRIVPADMRGRAASAWSGGFLIGGLAGPAVGGIFVSWSLRSPFFIYALTLLGASLVSWKYLNKAHLLENVVATSDEKFGFRKVLTSLPYLTALGTNFNVGLVRFGILNALVPLLIVKELGAPPVYASLAFLASSVAQASLLVFAGKTTDLRGRRISLIVGNGLTVVGMLLLAQASITLVIVLAMIVLGVAGSFLSSAPTAVVGDVTSGQKSGAAISAYQMAADFGAIFGPLIGGLLLDLSNGYTLPFNFAAILTLVFVGMSLMMKETRKN
jgi:MFS family permease